MTTMTHGDYIAKIDFDPEIGMFHGRITNIRSVVNFYGNRLRNCKRNLRLL